MTIRGRGINYDTGFFPGGKNSREHFDPDVVRREMRVIAQDLHCTGVRISGGDPARLSVAATCAAAEGLDIWFAPFPCELTQDELRPLFSDCAERAEAIRADGANVTLVLGCEMSLFTAGFLPGTTVYERIGSLTTPGGPSREDVRSQFNAFLAEIAADARERFHGPITYASGTWEDVDWTPFDVVGVDAYRDSHNAASYVADLRRHFRHGKPVAVTEFGCCTYKGAADRGGMGWAIVSPTAVPRQLDGDYVRDESEQVRYMTELLDIFDAEGVDSAFWFTFATYQSPYHVDPRFDFDMGAYGVVKMLDDVNWERKAAFGALANAYAGS